MKLDDTKQYLEGLAAGGLQSLAAWKMLNDIRNESWLWCNNSLGKEIFQVQRTDIIGEERGKNEASLEKLLSQTLRMVRRRLGKIYPEFS